MRRLLILIVCLAYWCADASAQYSEQQQIQKLNYVYQQIRNNYVDDVPLDPLVEEAIKATLGELDPHSSYLDKEAMAAMDNRMRGEYAGIGIRYSKYRDTIIVRSTVDGSPARRARVEINDRIISVNNQSVVGLSLDSVASLFKGAPNSKVSFDIVRRGSGKVLKFTIKRQVIESSAIDAHFRIGDVGYISIGKFSKPASSEFLKAYNELGDIKSLVVDLRGNGGGALTSAIELTGLFLKKGDVIVSVEGRTSSIVYDNKRDGHIIDIPVVVIIDEDSASASEIFAGAIQDHDRGVVIGHVSFGKGLVQRLIDLKDGTGISLTIARYKTPSGRVIQRPYTMGERESYGRDTMRYLHPDSIARDSSLMFKTLKRGRSVYGGGGITPDLYVVHENSELSERVMNIGDLSAFVHVAIEIFDRASPKSILDDYPTYVDFYNGFELSKEYYELFYSMIDSKPQDFTEYDKHFFRAMIMAVLAQQLYDDCGKSYVYGLMFDKMMLEALDIACSSQRYEQILEKGGK